MALELVNEWQKKQALRKAEEETWKLTPTEIKARARKIRSDLQAAKARLEGVIFEVVGGEMPRSLDVESEPPSYLLAQYLNPLLRGYYKRIEQVIPHEAQDDLDALNWEMGETCFQIGILAGFIFTGAPKKQLDALERGLAVATAARRWNLKAEQED